MAKYENYKELLKDYAINELGLKKSKGGYICPICGSGTGRHHTGAFSFKNDTTWHCFSCDKGGDIGDLYGYMNNTTDRAEILKGLADLYGDTEAKPVTKIPVRKEAAKVSAAKKIDQSAYYKECQANMVKSDYLAKRGIKEDLIKKFNIGYDPDKELIIIPADKYSFIGRYANGNAQRYANSRGEIAPFNAAALWQNKPVFVTEGAIDALSIMSANYKAQAMALNGKAKQKLFNELEKMDRRGQPFKNMIFLVYDADRDKEAAQQSKTFFKGVKDELEAKGIKAYLCNMVEPNQEKQDFKPVQDVNELLLQDMGALEGIIDRALKYANEDKEAQLAIYQANSTGNRVQAFIEDIEKRADYPAIPTGFPNLDKILDGGLYEGLYFIGALSSAGKTTFVLQIADQISKQGHDVLFIALEQGEFELMSKSISRLTFDLCEGNTNNAKTNRRIANKSFYKDFSKAEAKLLQLAYETYEQEGKHLYIKNKSGGISALDVKNMTMEHINATGNVPVVIVDYMQILKDNDTKRNYTDKQSTDIAVETLKDLSREYHVPIIGISSFNRENYNVKVSMSSFKESGAIEYSSDILLGIQPIGLVSGYSDKIKGANRDLIAAFKKSTVKDIEIEVLKNRNGKTGDTVQFTYYSMFNKYVEK